MARVRYDAALALRCFDATSPLMADAATICHADITLISCCYTRSAITHYGDNDTLARHKQNNISMLNTWHSARCLCCCMPCFSLRQDADYFTMLLLFITPYAATPCRLRRCRLMPRHAAFAASFFLLFVADITRSVQRLLLPFFCRLFRRYAITLRLLAASIDAFATLATPLPLSPLPLY